MLTDRDIVVKVLGDGKGPAVRTAGEVVRGEAVTIGADGGAIEILRTMTEHEVRRLPVIDGHTLVGVVARADVARALPDPQPRVGELLEALSGGPSTAGQEPGGQAEYTRVPFAYTLPVRLSEGPTGERPVLREDVRS